MPVVSFSLFAHQYVYVDWLGSASVWEKNYASGWASFYWVAKWEAASRQR